MKKLIVELEWLHQTQKVGELEVFQARGAERYQFTYDKDWVSRNPSFTIDPLLELSARYPQSSNELWGAFQDISPDRWGKLVQSRVANTHLQPSDYMLGVSDKMRMGALRLSFADEPELHLANNTDVPKLVNLRELEEAIHRLENGQETPVDLAILAEPGSSLGGAHPKASIVHNGKLYIAKFQSNLDTERVSLWEATMLDLARYAGINTANYLLINATGDKPILLVERFDRTTDGGRIPFASAMTLLGRNESNKDGASYIELSDAINTFSPQPNIDRRELFKRMTFNAMSGNIDDHLRNHGFLRQKAGWGLSPAYDINPTNELFNRRSHNLSFDGDRFQPSLAVCIELSPYFGLSKVETDVVLRDILISLEHWQKVAKNHGLRGDEIKHMENSFSHFNEIAKYLS
ncbi:MAG: HipA domain-containing protein [Enterobacteriaceae bacterium]|jgi:serine/threonine-protein kinase HipA|nr:HipA domain-containing protein [Enterobacteriaceae bacterium]